MKNNDYPPSYEESNDQYKTVSSNINNQSFELTKGPDYINVGQISLIADFIPWIESHSCEDIGYLLLRINNWLRLYPCYDIEKCELIPRMVNSRDMLEISNCYIFNMTYGRRYFVNLLRVHIKINPLKTEPDQICVRTIIPELIHGGSNNIENYAFLIRFLKTKKCQPKFQDMNEILTKLNSDIAECKITGTIVNISTFYLNVTKFFKGRYQEIYDDVCFYEESNQGRCLLKCLRVFYKPGSKINGNIEFKYFTNESKLIGTLNDLIGSAINWICMQDNYNFICLETFHEYEVKDEFGITQQKYNQNSTFSCYNNSSTLIRREVINLFYFTNVGDSIKRLQSHGKDNEIIWITPRRDLRKVYETYDSLMELLGYILINYGEHILDIETVLIPNPLSWKSVRTQTLTRYYSENSTNYQMYTFRLIVSAGKMKLPLKGAPLPFASNTKYSKSCSVI